MRKSKKIAVPDRSKPSLETSKTSWRIQLPERFLGELRKLPIEDRASVNEALVSVMEAWGKPHAHRGSGIRKLGADIFECRAGLRLRLLFRVEKPQHELVFFEVGNHDDIRRVLKRHP
jgi:mRNA-degrading endonuclease RelE of RelBE toxin-antitoxin system